MKSFTQIGMAAVLLLAVSSAPASASKPQHCDFAPVNNLHIPVGSHLAGGIDETTFNAVIDKMLAVWTPFAQAAGATLTFNRKWTDDTVNSSAEEHGKSWFVNAYGGLARHPLMTKDAMMMVFCHEMGHHLGGFPRMTGIFGSTSWAADEGQADYFATMKCFRRMIQDDDNETIVAAMKVPEDVKTQCATQLKETKDILICERDAMIGLNLADILHALTVSGGSSAEAQPDFATPDTSAVSSTNQDHPASQCRLDTYFNGSFCGVSYTEAFSKTAAGPGACAVENGDKAGYRPMCWYKPAN